jgi:glycosyltransferase involved in cell wall biosynthesis
MSDVPVSVVIPTYNRAALIGESVDSVLAAVSPGDEVIVVDDGSTDATEEALAPYQSMIRYLRIPNSGPGAARNHGIRAARNPLVAFNDSDDLWLADRLQLQRQVMQRRSELVFCFSDFDGLREDGARLTHGLGSWLAEFAHDRQPWNEMMEKGVLFSELGQLPQGREDFRVHVGNLYCAQLESNHVGLFTMLARRHATSAMVRFPEDISWGEDWEFSARLARVGPCAYLACATALQRAHGGARLTTADRGVKAGIQLTVLDRVWGADAAFLDQNSKRYTEVVTRARLMKARALIVLGKTKDARRELELAGGGPLSYRALAALPGGVVRGLLSARRSFAG